MRNALDKFREIGSYFAYAKEIIARLKPVESESTAAAIQQAIYEQDTGKLRSCIIHFSMVDSITPKLPSTYIPITS